MAGQQVANSFFVFVPFLTAAPVVCCLVNHAEVLLCLRKRSNVLISVFQFKVEALSLFVQNLVHGHIPKVHALSLPKVRSGDMLHTTKEELRTLKSH